MSFDLQLKSRRALVTGGTPAGPRPRFIIYCGFCGCRTVIAGTWEEAEIWWTAGAPDGADALRFLASKSGGIDQLPFDPADRCGVSQASMPPFDPR
jgi:hypothetical protein